MRFAAFCVFYLCLCANAHAQSGYGAVERSAFDRLFGAVHAERTAREGMMIAYRVIMQACKNEDVSLEKRAWVEESPFAAHREMSFVFRSCKDYKAANGNLVTREMLQLVMQKALNELLRATERTAQQR